MDLRASRRERDELVLPYAQLTRAEERSDWKWSRRAAQWRAVELAREAFGEEAVGRLAGYPPRGAFQGLVTLEVPFRDVDEHRRREEMFLTWAAADPVLLAVPVLFVFQPLLPSDSRLEGAGPGR